MIILDPTLIGRKYFTSDPKTIYTVRGVLIHGTPLVLGELPSTAPIGSNPNAPVSILVTHKLSEVRLLP